MIVDPAIVKARQRLLAEISDQVRATSGWTGRERLAPRVMKAFAEVPRENFVGDSDYDCAYLNRPLRIGFGQTISQPFIVALMTDLLDPEPTDRVLEIGTGCGYQTAVLARLVAQVFSIEVVPELMEMAGARLAALNCTNVNLRLGDGFQGWPEEAPYDGIIVTAAPPSLPQALVDQLKPGGRLIIPIGRTHDQQTLNRVLKQADGRLSTQACLPVAFVPMVHGRKGDESS